MAQRMSANILGAIAGWLGMILLAGAALAADSAGAGEPRLAIKGYDPVAYFTEGRPVLGSAQFEQIWEDTRWRFASAANLERFKADPDRYAPQYAGYCAFGMAEGAKYEVDPTVWKIVGGKLYLHHSKSVQQDWAKDQSANIARADASWMKIIK